MEKVSFLARIQGMVQGVGYRYFAYREAVALELTGYVRNLSDGRVEVYAEGAREKLDKFLIRLNQGPRFGRVEDVEVEWSESHEKYEKFFIDSGYGN